MQTRTNYGLRRPPQQTTREQILDNIKRNDVSKHCCYCKSECLQFGSDRSQPIEHRFVTVITRLISGDLIVLPSTTKSHANLFHLAQGDCIKKLTHDFTNKTCPKRNSYLFHRYERIPDTCLQNLGVSASGIQTCHGMITDAIWKHLVQWLQDTLLPTTNNNVQNIK